MKGNLEKQIKNKLEDWHIKQAHPWDPIGAKLEEFV